MKKIIMLGVLVLVVGGLTACQKSGAGEESPVVPSGQNANAGNPMVEYPDLVSLQNEVGFMMPDLPSEYEMTNRQYFAIGETLAEVRGEDGSGARVCIRKAAGQDDISGYYDVKFEPGAAGYYEVFLGSSKDTQVSWWKDDIYSYSFSLEGGDEAGFTERLNVLAREAAFIRMFEAELPGGQALLRSIEELDAVMGYPVMRLSEDYLLSPAVIGIAAGGEGYIRYRDGVSNDRYIDLLTIREEQHEFTGLDGMATDEKSVLDIPVTFGEGADETEGKYFAGWENNGLSYAAVAFGHTAEEFDQVLEDLVKATKR